MNMRNPGYRGSCCVLLFLFGAVSHATPLDDALKSNDETSFSGIIMEVHMITSWCQKESCWSMKKGTAGHIRHSSWISMESLRASCPWLSGTGYSLKGFSLVKAILKEENLLPGRYIFFPRNTTDATLKKIPC